MSPPRGEGAPKGALKITPRQRFDLSEGYQPDQAVDTEWLELGFAPQLAANYRERGFTRPEDALGYLLGRNPDLAKFAAEFERFGSDLFRSMA